jgi:hypothetical protein
VTNEEKIFEQQQNEERCQKLAKWANGFRLYGPRKLPDNAVSALTEMCITVTYDDGTTAQIHMERTTEPE